MNQLWKSGAVRNGGKFIMPWLGEGTDAAFKRPGFVPLFTWLMNRTSPTFPLPGEFDIIKPKFNEKEQDAKCTWIGHSTCLLQVSGVNILTDAVFSERCSPLQFVGPKRYTPPACSIAELPPIHLVLTSHDHYDHLDYASALELEERYHPIFACGLELGGWFRENMNVPKERIVELDWWENRSLFNGKVDLQFVPVQHWSKRQAIGDECRSLWGGLSLKTSQFKFFFNGDTGYHQELYDEIGKRCGPFDLAAIPVGAYAPRDIMQIQHIDPAEAFLIHKHLQSRVSFGIHHATFILTDEPVREPAEKINEISKANPDIPPFYALKHGAALKFSGSDKIDIIEE